MKTRRLNITVRFGGKSGSASVPIAIDSDEQMDPTELARFALALLVQAARNEDASEAAAMTKCACEVCEAVREYHDANASMTGYGRGSRATPAERQTWLRVSNAIRRLREATKGALP